MVGILRIHISNKYHHGNESYKNARIYKMAWEFLWDLLLCEVYYLYVRVGQVTIWLSREFHSTWDFAWYIQYFWGY
jgi:hypothetical protein